MRETIEWLLALPDEERLRMELAEDCRFTRSSPAPPLQQEFPGQQVVVVPALLSAGTVEAGVLLQQLGLRPVLLNFAHGYNCGGGFEHSGGSQEEDIFRKTSLFLSLWPHRREDDGPGVLARGMWIGDFDDALARKTAFYPHSECGGIYSPHIRVVRDLAIRGRPLLSAAKAMSVPAMAVMSAAAQDVGREGSFDAALLREKVRTVLHLALAHGHDSVVLGAFGCGYFKNPAGTVAEIFNELLQGEFRGAFDVVVFAVPDRMGPNLDAFSERFPVQTEAELTSSVQDRRVKALPSNTMGKSCGNNCATM